MISKKLKILQKLGIEILLGIELEFYLKDQNFSIETIKNLEIKKEIGENQFEAIFPLNVNVFSVLKSVILFRNKFTNTFNFESYISENEPNSGMQFNFSLWKNGENIMENPEILNAIIFSLLKFLPESISSFTKNENCTKRLKDLEKIKRFRNSPCNISCGFASNRTTAIRVIYENSDNYRFNENAIKGYRIEHRVPSSFASVLKSFNAILEAIIYALNLENAPKVQLIHSNAFEDEIIEKFSLIPL